MTKQFTTLAGQGIETLLTSWTTWALVASALLGIALAGIVLLAGAKPPAPAEPALAADDLAAAPTDDSGRT